MKGPFPTESPFGAIGRTGSPEAYLIDPGAGSASDRVSRFWPMPFQLDNINQRGGEITPLYARHPLRIVISYEHETLCADTPDRPGMVPVGYSETCMYEALGRWLHANRSLVGVVIELDDSAIPHEMARRREELSDR